MPALPILQRKMNILTKTVWNSVACYFCDFQKLSESILCHYRKCQYTLTQKTLEDISKVFQEVPPGFEPGIEVLQTFALPLGYGTIFTFYYM